MGVHCTHSQKRIVRLHVTPQSRNKLAYLLYRILIVTILMKALKRNELAGQANSVLTSSRYTSGRMDNCNRLLNQQSTKHVHKIVAKGSML